MSRESDRPGGHNHDHHADEVAIEGLLIEPSPRRIHEIENATRWYEFMRRIAELQAEAKAPKILAVSDIIFAAAQKTLAEDKMVWTKPGEAQEMFAKAQEFLMESAANVLQSSAANKLAKATKTSREPTASLKDAIATEEKDQRSAKPAPHRTSGARWFSHILPLSVRDRVYEPMYEELHEDYLSDLAREPDPRVWQSLNRWFTFQTALLVGQCLWAVCSDKAHTVVVKAVALALGDRAVSSLRSLWAVWFGRLP